jgi:putative transcriptional regulator
MSNFGKDLVKSLCEALEHAKGEEPAVLHSALVSREVRKPARLAKAQPRVRGVKRLRAK